MQDKDAKSAVESKKIEEAVAITHKASQEKQKASEDQKKESQATLEAVADVKKSLQEQHKKAATSEEREHAEHLL
jgi:hypothetical protein